jgi:hypothetical protein
MTTILIPYIHDYARNMIFVDGENLAICYGNLLKKDWRCAPFGHRACLILSKAGESLYSENTIKRQRWATNNILKKSKAS